LLGQFNLINYNAVEREMWHVASSMWHLGGHPVVVKPKPKTKTNIAGGLPQFQL